MHEAQFLRVAMRDPTLLINLRRDMTIAATFSRCGLCGARRACACSMRDMINQLFELCGEPYVGSEVVPFPYTAGASSRAPTRWNESDKSVAFAGEPKCFAFRLRVTMTNG